jgi:hypothetical protein
VKIQFHKAYTWSTSLTRGKTQEGPVLTHGNNVEEFSNTRENTRMTMCKTSKDTKKRHLCTPKIPVSYKKQKMQITTENIRAQ